MSKKVIRSLISNITAWIITIISLVPLLLILFNSLKYEELLLYLLSLNEFHSVFKKYKTIYLLDTVKMRNLNCLKVLLRNINIDLPDLPDLKNEVTNDCVLYLNEIKAIYDLLNEILVVPWIVLNYM